MTTINPNKVEVTCSSSKNNNLTIYMNEEALKAVKKKKEFISAVTEISEAMIESKDIKSFSALMDKHEDLVAHHTGFKKVKEERFSDFSGSVKSLGAWGGDFVMASSSKSEADTKAYFANKGYNTVLSYDEMI